MLLLSIDGLRPESITGAGRTPNLRRLMEAGVYASTVRGVLPTVTYASHTTLLTGVYPAKHGIESNRPFDPAQRGQDIWYWFNQDIRVPTLWDAAAQAGYVVGSVSWPVSVGSRSIHFNIPEYAGSRTEHDVKMVRALAGPAVMAGFAAKAGEFLTDVNQAVARDWSRTRYAIELIRQKHTRFLTVHWLPWTTSNTKMAHIAITQARR